MSADLVLKPTCSGCGSPSELYGTTCKHLTLCVSCGKTMAQNHGTCNKCGAPITRLIREYNVRACSTNEKNYFIGRFATGLPNFSKKRSENKWCLQKEGLQGRQVTDALRERFKNKPWLLEDESGQSQYHGQPEGAQSATYYLLMLQGREFVAIPAGSWYNFNKVAQYKQLTLEEAEEKMNNRRKTADGYQRWMMKAANNGPAAFGEAGKFDDKEGGGGGGGGRARRKSGDDEGNASDQGEEEEDDNMDRKHRPGHNKKGGDDDEEGPRGGDLDDEDDIEKGDDWEHEEIFTDDDEAPGNDPEEREDLAPEIPVPPEIKQDDEDEEEADGEGGWGLSESGKELKKILGKANGMNESDPEDDDDDEEEDDFSSPVLAPKPKVTPKEEQAEASSPAKPPGSSSTRASSSTSKSAKGKRKANGDEPKSANGVPSKKVKSETDVKPVKGVVTPAANNSMPNNVSSSSAVPPARTAVTPVTEDEIRAVLLQQRPVTTSDLVSRFKSRLKSKEDKDTFAAVLRKISRIQKTETANYVVLRER
ncbi:hypothetical protein DM860_003627 [Cuscuta australis]|uniref:Transcription initiation factor IIF subunit alpha n=1 Tax=Cuscuta australis TaxID=267555 RepID=A0A328DJT5_9ASTE|nr:hypothetical protein DM860_003627 [Cuscuta australis]